MGIEVTDIERFLELYKSLGIELKVYSKETYKNWNGTEVSDALVVYLGSTWALVPRGEVIDTRKFQGYGGFYSDVVFAKDGKFVCQGFWE